MKAESYKEDFFRLGELLRENLPEKYLRIQEQ